MISLKDIARICDVSESTVSKALKGRPEIKAATRERIEMVAKRYNYQPNAIVESIQTGRSRTIGIAYNNFDDSFSGAIMNSILRCLHQSNYDVMVICWDLIVAEGAGVLSRFSRRRVDGLLLFPMAQLPSPFYLKELQNFHSPVVVIDQTWAGNEFNFVGSDNFGGANLAVDHLISRGITRIGCISNRGISSGQERFSGFQEAMARHGLTVRQSDCVNIDDCFADNQAIIRPLLDRPDHPEALVCFNDYLALEAASAAADLGMNVPRELSLVGFGKLPLGTRMRPQLSTVDQFPEEIGSRATEILLEAIESQNTVIQPQNIRIPVKLLERASVR